MTKDEIKGKTIRGCKSIYFAWKSFLQQQWALHSQYKRLQIIKSIEIIFSE